MPRPLATDSRTTLLEEADAKLDGDRDALAREYGFHTWRQLDQFLAVRAEDGPKSEDAADDFLLHACLLYAHPDAPERRERARRLLEESPDLARSSLHAAACVGDVEEVARRLDAEPELVNRRGGPFDWEPLLYACYSRLDLPEGSTLDVAKLLLQRGADPNAHYMWGGQYRFTALTGAFGEGERGPTNQPPHARWEELARTLLEAGAEPNDSQAIYNRMFKGDLGCIEMLLEFGLGPDDRTNWIDYDCNAPDGVGESDATLDYLLSWDIEHFHIARAKLCIDHGADIHRVEDGRSLLARARIQGNREVAEYLAQKGARIEGMRPVDAFAAALMNAEAEEARAMLAADGDLVDRLNAEYDNLLHDAASSGRVDALRTAIAVGLDIDRYNWRTPLHEAAGQGRLEAVKLLVEAGARIANRDNPYAGSVLDWAKYDGHQNVLDWLETRDDLEIFEAIALGQQDRVRELVEADPSLLGRTLRDDRQDPSEPLDWEWKTPLASAITRERAEMVRLLIELGAPTDTRSPAGQTLIELAREDSTEEIVGILEAAAGS